MDLVPIIIVPTCVYFFFKFLESLVRRRERIIMVEKLDFSNQHSLPPIDSLNVSDYMPTKRFFGLRTGLLLVGIGLGLMLAWMLTLFTAQSAFLSGEAPYYVRNMFQVIYLAAPACFGGIGLIISYVIEQKWRKYEK